MRTALRVLLVALSLLSAGTSSAQEPPVYVLTQRGTPSISNLYVFAGDCLTQVTRLRLPTAGNLFAQYLAVDPTGSRAYVSMFGVPGALDVVDLTAPLRVLSSISGDFSDLVLNPAGTRLYIVVPTGVAVYDVTVTPPSLVTTVPVSGARRPAVNPAGTLVYVSTGNGVHAIDTSSNTDALAFGAGLATDALAVKADGTRVYVVIQNMEDDLGVFTDLGVPVTTITGTVAARPSTVAVNPALPRLYVDGHTVVDTDTNTVVGSLGISGQAAVNTRGTRVAVDTGTFVHSFDTSTNADLGSAKIKTILGVAVAIGPSVSSAACTAGGTVFLPKLTLTRLGSPLGDEGFHLKGDVVRNGSVPLSPATQGAQLLLEDIGAGTTAIFNLTSATDPIPPGGPGSGCAPGDGWVSGGTSSTYTNQSGTIDPPACTPGSAMGLGKLSFQDHRRNGLCGKIHVTAVAAGASIAPPIGPVRATVVFGASAGAGTAGDCGLVTLDCVTGSGGTTMNCQ